MVAEPMLAGGQLVAGIQRLVETPITINGQTPSRLIWRGRDASASGWAEHGGAGTLALAGSGSDPSYQQPAPFKEGKSCKGEGGKYFEAGDNDLGNITTEDYIVETAVKFDDTVSAGSLYGKRASSGDLEGSVIIGASAKLTMLIDAGVPEAVNVYSPALADVGWYLLHWIIRRASSGICYANASAGTAVDVTSVAGSLSCAAPLQLGQSYGSVAGKHGIGCFSLVIASGWLDSHLQPDFVRERLALLTGHRFLRDASGLYVPGVL